jgi:hypothetical protein
MELTKDFVKNCRKTGVLQDFLCQAIDQVNARDKEIAELKAKLEDAKATAYAESVDAGMRERKLKRALWLARAERARDKATMFWNRLEDVNCHKWQRVKHKCRAKAEEYK